LEAVRWRSPLFVARTLTPGAHRSTTSTLMFWFAVTRCNRRMPGCGSDQVSCACAAVDDSPSAALHTLNRRIERMQPGLQDLLRARARHLARLANVTADGREQHRCRLCAVAASVSEPSLVDLGVAPAITAEVEHATIG